MKLLIVDDSKLILKHAENILTNSVIECEIILAKSGEEAFEILETRTVDIVVLDIIMPGISGIEVLRKIKSDDKLKNIKVLMFSSLVDKKTLQECFEIGAIDYITKPLEEIEFLARVKSVIKEKALENKILSQINTSEAQNSDVENKIEFSNMLESMNNNISDLKKYLAKYNLLIELYQTYRNEMIFFENNESKIILETISNYEKKNNVLVLNRTIEETIKAMENSLEYIKDNTNN